MRTVCNTKGKSLELSIAVWIQPTIIRVAGKTEHGKVFILFTHSNFACIYLDSFLAICFIAKHRNVCSAISTS